MGAYSYQPLDASRSQIRLLKIDRSLSPTAKVRCHLEVFDLYNAPHYTGLSYRWTYLEPDTAQRPSPEVTKKSMVVDGKLFYVSENLANFLEVFREQPQNEPIWLWIDQICINQEDIPERNQQIRLMSDIYIRCQTVII
ncbi:heterokaryon incompatibility protein-domain-containing protein, partial [Tricladium varicosporioides]